jgi:hypothetical protein
MTEKFKSLIKIENSISNNLFIICVIITIVTMAITVADFFGRGTFVPAKINFFYISVVAIYSLHKELIRWLGEKKAKRGGEFFVYAWVILTTILYVINFLSHDYYSYSAEGYQLGDLRDITYLTIEVLGLFFLTRILKILEVFMKSRLK